MHHRYTKIRIITKPKHEITYTRILFLIEFYISKNRPNNSRNKRYTHWDMNEFDEVADEAHDCKSDCHSFADLNEL
jgi:hypothetical protein